MAAAATPALASSRRTGGRVGDAEGAASIAAATPPGLAPLQLDVLLAILEEAAPAVDAPHAVPSLLEVLRAYERVLPRFGLQSSGDSFFYRFLLHMSLNPAISWWEKLRNCLEATGTMVDPRVQMKAALAARAQLPLSPRPPAAATAADAAGGAASSTSEAAALSPAGVWTATLLRGERGGSAQPPPPAAAPMMAPPLPLPPSALAATANSLPLPISLSALEATRVVAAPHRHLGAGGVTPRAGSGGGLASAAGATASLSVDGATPRSADGALASASRATAFADDGFGPRVPLTAVRSSWSASARGHHAASAGAATWDGGGDGSYLHAARSPLSGDDDGAAADSAYAAHKAKARTFRRWLAAVVYSREARRVHHEMITMKVAAAAAAREQRLLARVWIAFVGACREGIAAKRAIITAVEHWASSLQHRCFRSWRSYIQSQRPQPLYHPAHIRAVFKWVALTLPDRGEWWRLAAAHHAALEDATRRALMEAPPPSPADGGAMAARAGIAIAATFAATTMPAAAAAAPAAFTRRRGHSDSGSDGGDSVSGAGRGSAHGMADAFDSVARSHRASSAPPRASAAPAIRHSSGVWLASPPPPAAATTSGGARARDAASFGAFEYDAMRRTAAAPVDGASQRRASWHGPPSRDDFDASFSDMPLPAHAGVSNDAWRASGGGRLGSTPAAVRRRVASPPRWPATSPVVVPSYGSGSGVDGADRTVWQPSAILRDGAAAALSPLLHTTAPATIAAGMLAAARQREERLGRLRGYVVSRIAPPLRKLPLLEHGTALYDAHALIAIFGSWRVWARRAAGIRRRNEQQRAAIMVRRWLANAQLASHMAATHALVALRADKSCMLLAWFAWRRQLAEVRMLAATAETCHRQYTRWLARRVWGRWLRYMAFLARLRQRAEQQRLVTLAAAVAAWRNRAAWQAAANAKATALQRRHAMAAKQRYLAQWRWSQRLTHLSTVATTFFGATSLAHTWRSWRAHLAQQRHMEAGAVAALERRSRVVAWRRWRAAVDALARMRTVVRRLMHSTSARAFGRWREYVQQRQAARATMLAVATRLRLRGAVAAVTYWRDWAGSRVDERAAVADLGSRLLLAQKRARFDAWRQRLAFAVQARQLLRTWRARAATRAVVMWQATAASRIRSRGIMAAIVGRMRHSAAAAAFTTWKAFLLRRRAQHALQRRGDDAMQQLRLARSVRHWLALVRGRQRFVTVAERALRRMRFFVAARCFETWKAYLQQRRHEKAVQSRVIVVFRNLGAARAVRQWRDVAAEGARQRGVMSRVISLMQGSRILQALARWQAWVHQLRSDRVVMRRVVHIMQHASAVRAVRWWQQVASTQARLRATAAALHEERNSRKVVATLGLWRDWSKRRQHNRTVVSHVVTRLRLVGVHRSWNAWLEFTAGARAARIVMARAVATMQHARAVACIRSWQRQAGALARNRALLLRAAMHMRQQAVAAAFNGWRAFLIDRRQRRHAALDVWLGKERAVLRASWQRWAAFHAEQRASAAVRLRVVQRLRCRHLAGAVQAWREHAADAIAKREQQAAGAAFDRRHTLSRGFSLWRHELHRRARLFVLATRVDASLARFQLASAMHAWRGNAVATARAEALRNTVLTFWRAGSMGAAFRAWKAARADAVARRRVHADATVQLHRFVAARAVVQWRHHSNLSRRLRGVVTRMVHRGMAAAFQQWQGWWRQRVACRAAHESAAVAAVANRQRSTVARVLGAWRTWAQPRAEGHRAGAGMAAQLRARSLVAHFRAMRLMAAVTAHHRSSVGRRAFAGFATLIQRRRASLSLLAASATARLQGAFSLWRDTAAVVRDENAAVAAFAARLGAAPLDSLAGAAAAALLRPGYGDGVGDDSGGDVNESIAAPSPAEPYSAAGLAASQPRARSHAAAIQGAVARGLLPPRAGAAGGLAVVDDGDGDGEGAAAAVAVAARPTGPPSLLHGIVATWRGAAVAPAFRAWAAHALRQRQVAAMAEAAETMAAARSSARALRAWRIVHRAAVIDRAAAAYRRNQLLRLGWSTLARAVRARAVARRRKAALQAAADRFHALCLQSAHWMRWRAAAEARAGLLAAVEGRFVAAQTARCKLAFEALRATAHRGRILRAAAASFAASGVAAQLQRIVRRWREVSDDAQAWRTRSFVHWWRAAAGRAVATWRWRLSLARTAALRDAAATALTARIASRTTRSLVRTWQQTTVRQQRLRAVVLAAEERARLAVVATAWHAWQEEQRRRQRADAYAVMAAARLTTLRVRQQVARWQAWRGTRAGTRAVVARLTVSARHHTRAAAWASWREAFALRAGVRGALAGLVVGLRAAVLGAAIRNWAAGAASIRRAEAQAHSAEALLRRCTHRRGFRAWREAFAHCRAVAGAEEACVALHRRCSALRALQLWHRVAHARAVVSRGTAAIASKRAARDARGVVAAWREYARHRRLVAVGIATLQQSCRSQAFAAWREAAADSKLGRQAGAVWFARGAGNAVRRWQRWAAVVAWQRGVSARRRSTTLGGALAAWRKLALRCKADRFAAARTHTSLVHLVRTWSSAAAYSTALARAGATVAAQAARGAAMRAVWWWRRSTRIAAAIALRDEARTFRDKRSVFAAIRAFSLYRQSKRYRSTAAASVIVHGRLERVFVGWKGVVTAARAYALRLRREVELRDRVEARLARAETARKAAAMAAWKLEAARAHALRELSRRVDLATLLRPALRRWAAAAASGRRLDACGAVVAAAVRRSSLRLHLAAWLAAAVRSRRLAAVTAAVTADAANRNAETLSAVFRAWAGVRQRTLTAAALAGRLQLRQSRSLLRAWADAACAVGWCRRNRLARVWASWRRFQHAQRERLASSGEAVRVACTTRRVAAAWAVWQAGAAAGAAREAALSTMADAALRTRLRVAAVACLRRLRDVARSQRQLRLAQWHAQVTAGRRALACWRRSTAAATQRGRAAAATSTRLRRRTLAACLAVWKARCLLPSVQRRFAADSMMETDPDVMGAAAYGAAWGAVGGGGSGDGGAGSMWVGHDRDMLAGDAGAGVAGMAGRGATSPRTADHRSDAGNGADSARGVRVSPIDVALLPSGAARHGGRGATARAGDWSAAAGSPAAATAGSGLSLALAVATAGMRGAAAAPREPARVPPPQPTRFAAAVPAALITPSPGALQPRRHSVSGAIGAGGHGGSLQTAFARVAGTAMYAPASGATTTSSLSPASPLPLQPHGYGAPSAAASLPRLAAPVPGRMVHVPAPTPAGYAGDRDAPTESVPLYHGMPARSGEAPARPSRSVRPVVPVLPPHYSEAAAPLPAGATGVRRGSVGGGGPVRGPSPARMALLRTFAEAQSLTAAAAEMAAVRAVAPLRGHAGGGDVAAALAPSPAALVAGSPRPLNVADLDATPHGRRAAATAMGGAGSGGAAAGLTGEVSAAMADLIAMGQRPRMRVASGGGGARA